MTALLRLATVVAVVTLVYCAVSVWAVALPGMVPAMATCVVSILTVHFTYQLRL